MRVYFGSDAAFWNPVQDEQESILDSLSLVELVRSEIVALSGQESFCKSLTTEHAINQEQSQHLIIEPTMDSFSAARIDIVEQDTPSVRSENRCAVRVCIVAPMDFHEEGGLVHHAIKQSTRVPASPRQMSEGGGQKDYCMNLRGTVYAQQFIFPSLEAVANSVGKNSSCNGELVLAAPEMLSQKVVTEANLLKSRLSDTESLSRLSESVIKESDQARSPTY